MNLGFDVIGRSSLRRDPAVDEGGSVNAGTCLLAGGGDMSPPDDDVLGGNSTTRAVPVLGG